MAKCDRDITHNLHYMYFHFWSITIWSFIVDKKIIQRTIYVLHVWCQRKKIISSNGRVKPCCFFIIMKGNLNRPVEHFHFLDHFAENSDGTPTIERFNWRHAVLQHGRRITQTDLDIQGSHVHHVRSRSSSCAWTTNGEVHGETVTHNNAKRCSHKWILISVAIEAAMLADSMTSHENAL